MTISNGMAKCIYQHEKFLLSPYPVPMSPWKKEALKASRKELGNVPMEELGMLKKLEKPGICNPAHPSFGFLSQNQLQVVESLSTDIKRMNKVIDYLLEMEDKYFEHFCTILEQENFQSKANLLRDRAKELKAACGTYTAHLCMHACMSTCALILSFTTTL